MPGISLEQLIDTLNQRLSRDMGKAAFAKARQTCPVQTGDLYDSLYVNITRTGFELGATVSYASDVEEGTPPVTVAGSYTGKWKRHKRRTKNGTTTVRGHTKTFKGKKPVLMNGATKRSEQEWLTLSSSPGREGTFFIKKALDDSIDEVMNKVMASLGAKRS